ncbi:hypothetical protein ACFQO7_22765 [Catellatospora aurea]|uniref:Uncharacterized protein n=1 Tax=Catellatospora aurea TaxID=1337874 RepID=A0ABW2H0A2_9ACTN
MTHSAMINIMNAVKPGATAKASAPPSLTRGQPALGEGTSIVVMDN